MKIKTIRFKKYNEITQPIPPEKEREVKGMIIALALFAAGMIVGAGFLKNYTSEPNQDFMELFDSYILARAQQKAYVTFLNSLTINLIFIFLAFCSGISCIGLPISVILPVIKGLGFGMLAGYLFSNFSMSGIGYYLLTIFPGAVVANSALLLSCNCSGFMSADILAILTNKKQGEDKMLRDYIKKYCILTLLSVAASMIDCVLTKAFAYLFSI